MLDKLQDTRIRIEYATVRDPENWNAQDIENAPGGYSGDKAKRQARALVAAYIGEVRLIDNLRLDVGMPSHAPPVRR